MNASSSSEELRNELIGELTVKRSDETRALIKAGDAQTLHDFANAVGDAISEKGVGELLVRVLLNSHEGALAAGLLLQSLLNRAIDSDAEHEAVKSVERTEYLAATERRQQKSEWSRFH